MPPDPFRRPWEPRSPDESPSGLPVGWSEVLRPRTGSSGGSGTGGIGCGGCFGILLFLLAIPAVVSFLGNTVFGGGSHTAPSAVSAQPGTSQGIHPGDPARTWEGTVSDRNTRIYGVAITLTQSGSGNQGIAGTIRYKGFQCDGSLSETQDDGSSVVIREEDLANGCTGVTWRFALDGPESTTLTVVGNDDTNKTLQGVLGRTKI